MGIDFTAVAAGLGAGLTSIGNSREDKRKEALLQKLQLEHEDRVEQYAKNSEDRAIARDKAKPSGPPEFIDNGNGTWTKRVTNSYGQTLTDTPATPSEVEDINMAKQSKKLSLDNMTAQKGLIAAQTNESYARAQDAPLNRQAARENIQSSIQAREDNTTDRRQAMQDKEDAKELESTQNNAVLHATTMLGKPVLVPDKANPGKKIRKIASPEYVEAYLRHHFGDVIADKFVLSQVSKEYP